MGWGKGECVVGCCLVLSDEVPCSGISTLSFSMIFKNNLPVSFIVMSVGGLCLAGSAYIFYQSGVFTSLDGRTTGTVVGIGSYGAPEVSFTTSDGRVVLFTNPIGEQRPSVSIGETVPVFYSTHNPQKARTPVTPSGAFTAAFFGVLFMWLGLRLRRAEG